MSADDKGSAEINDLKMAEGMVADGIELPPDLKKIHDAEHPKQSESPGSPADKPSEDKPSPAEPDKPTPKVEPGGDEGGEKEVKPEGGEKVPEGEKGGVVAPPEPRGVKTVPLDTKIKLDKEIQQLKKDKNALEGQLSNLPEKTDEDYEKEVAEVAESIGIDVTAVKKLETLFAKKHQLPAEVLETIKEAKQITETNVYWEKQGEKFDEEFGSDVSEIKKTDEAEALLMEKNKERIRELAFTFGYNNKSSWEIWTRYVKPSLTPGKKTVETPDTGGVGGAPGGRDWSKVVNDPVAIRGLSKKEFEEFDKWMESQSGGTTLRPARTL